MKYALNLGEDFRILSAWIVLPNGDYSGMTLIDYLPDGDISEYLYIEDKYVYSPIQDQNQDEYVPTADEILNTLLGCGYE